jgi:hypothetical protein
MFQALALSALLVLHPQQDKPPQEPRTAPVVGHVDVQDYIKTKARLLSLEAQLKDCEERTRRRRHFLRRLLRAITLR